jgi:hypothetical protein
VKGRKPEVAHPAAFPCAKTRLSVGRQQAQKGSAISRRGPRFLSSHAPRYQLRQIAVLSGTNNRSGPFHLAKGKCELFFFFSNRLGCLGSLLISAAITIGLLFLFGVFR